MLCLNSYLGGGLMAAVSGPQPPQRPPRWPWERTAAPPAPPSPWPLWLSRVLERPVSALPPPPPIPASTGPVVFWTVTRGCNLACARCHVGSVSTPGNDELRTREALEIVSRIAAMHPAALVFWGGEPLLREDLFDLIARASSLGLTPVLFTNGAPLDRLAARLLRKAGLSMALVSVEAVEKSNDALRSGSGSFDDAERALRLLRDKGLRSGMRFHLRRGNSSEFPTAVRYAATEGIEEFVVSHPTNLARGGPVSRQVLPSPELRECFEKLASAAIAAESKSARTRYWTDGMDCDAAMLLRRIEAEFPKAYTAAETMLREYGGNGAGSNVAWVDATGCLFPEPFFPDEPLADLRRASPEPVWGIQSETQGMAIHPLLKDLRRRKELLVGRCGRCKFLDACNGGSRTRAFLAFGDRWASEPDCYLSDAEIAIPEHLRGSLDHVRPTAES